MATKLHRLKGDQFFDDSGNPLNGGKLTFYQAGTTTLQSTFSDSAGASANANPLTLDSSGRLTVSVYFGDSGTYANYKETLTDSALVTISNWPIDNLPAAEPAATAAAFAPPLLAWTQITSAASPVALAASDAGKAYEVDTTSGNIEFDLPSAASIGNGKGFLFKKTIAANSMVIDPSGTETIDNDATSLTITQQYQVVAIFSNGAEWYVAWQYLDVSAASDTVAGKIEIAIQSEMETATSTLLAVTPGRQHFHPGHPKFWAKATVAAGVPTLQTSYNVTSIADTGVGLLTVTIATDFSSANWCAGVTVEYQTGEASGQLGIIDTGGLSAGAIVARCMQTGASANATLDDPDSWHIMGSGDHA